MFRFGMTDVVECERFGEIEDTKLLLFECPFSHMAWNNFKKILNERSLESEKVSSYEKLFDFEGPACVNLVKLKLIN